MMILTIIGINNDSNIQNNKHSYDDNEHENARGVGSGSSS